MTRERAKELLPIITAYAEGKRIEFTGLPGSWCDWVDELKFDSPASCYRIAPEPNIRPWNVDEVPHLARIRDKDRFKDGLVYSTILGVNNSFEVLCLNGCYKTSYLLDHCEHSTDGGKTWLPCGVVEGEK